MRRDAYKDVAESIPFDNATNGFTADNTQAAIEEAKQYTEGFPRAAIRGTYNGVVSGNSWLGPNELLPNTPFITFAVNIQINEISWSNQNTDVAFRVQFRLNSKTGTIFHTLTVTSPNSGTGYQSGLSYILNAGDTIYAQYLDDGTNCSDMDLILWVSRYP